MGDKPAEHPAHTLVEGCRFAHGEKEVARRVKKQLGQQAKAGPCRDLAILAAGVVDGDPIIDDFDLDGDFPGGAFSAPGGGAIIAPQEDRVITGDEAFGALRGDSGAVTKEEGEGHTPQNPDFFLPDSVYLTDESPVAP